MMREEVILPEPGRSLLRTTWTTLNKWLDDSTGKHGFVIGGGTMLAARWHHRDSKDLDIRVAEGDASGAVVQMAFDPSLQTRFDQAMQRAGARHRQRSSMRQLVYIFGTPEDPGAPRVDLVELPPKLNIPSVWTQTEGMTFWSASNAEILAGKWKDRRSDLVVRDVYDFGVAGLMDGHAVQQALATDGDRHQLEEMVARLAAGREALKSEAATDVLGVPQNLLPVREDPARWAALAIGKWALTGIDITREAGAWKVSTRCKATAQATERMKCNTLDAAAEHTAQLSGLPNDVIAEMMREAHQSGGASRDGPGAQLTACTHREMRVDAQGTVSMRDFGETETRAPTIEAAIEIAVERGWESRESSQQAAEELRALRREAMLQKQEARLR